MHVLLSATRTPPLVYSLDYAPADHIPGRDPKERSGWTVQSPSGAYLPNTFHKPVEWFGDDGSARWFRITFMHGQSHVPLQLAELLIADGLVKPGDKTDPVYHDRDPYSDFIKQIDPA